MTDADLLHFYLARGGPEAARWNLSPECAYLDHRLRQWAREHIVPFPGVEVCNIGIGVGEWDDYLGHLLCGSGRLTSVDFDPDLCECLRYRQIRERHPNPSRVVCVDLLTDTLEPGGFDFVTIIGSTATETGDERAALLDAARLVRPGGRLFCAGLLDRVPFPAARVIAHECDDRLAELPFHLFVVEPSPLG